jgi:hypothetical protein
MAARQDGEEGCIGHGSGYSGRRSVVFITVSTVPAALIGRSGSLWLSWPAWRMWRNGIGCYWIQGTRAAGSRARAVRVTGSRARGIRATEPKAQRRRSKIRREAAGMRSTLPISTGKLTRIRYLNSNLSARGARTLGATSTVKGTDGPCAVLLQDQGRGRYFAQSNGIDERGAWI